MLINFTSGETVFGNNTFLALRHFLLRVSDSKNQRILKESCNEYINNIN